MLLAVAFKKVHGRKYCDTYTQSWGVMSVIAGNQIFGITGYGNFKTNASRAAAFYRRRGSNGQVIYSL